MHLNKKKLKIALCIMAKKEYRYIIEFIEYYKKLGIKKIFLYDNNDIKGEIYDDILKEFINNGFVKIYNFRGLFKPQELAYKQCYENNKYIYDWIAFFDVDEYLYFNNCSNINNFFSLSNFKNCFSVLINWKYYGDNNNIYYKPYPLQKRFIKPFKFSNKNKKNIVLYAGAKTIVRGGLNITWAHFPHYLKNPNICNSEGKIIKNPLTPPNYSMAFIKHYATKSTEEYIEHLIRGGGCSKNQNNKKFMINRIKSYYFLFNKITNKKINLFEKKLNINLRKFYKNKRNE